MATNDVQNIQDRLRQQYREATEMAVKSVGVWNELLAASTDMAFDVVLKNWNYSRSLRSSAEQAIEDAIKTQHQLSNEMLQVWQGYAGSVKDIVERSTR